MRMPSPDSNSRRTNYSLDFGNTDPKRNRRHSETKEQYLRHLVEKLLDKVDKVTTHYRSGRDVPERELRVLSNRQTEIERQLRLLK